MKPAYPSESLEQEVVVQFCDLRNIPVYAIPNGSNKSPAAAAKFRREGLRPGVPDLCIPLARGGYHGLYVEMKKVKGGAVSDNQKRWIDTLNRMGYLAVVCKGADAAIKTIKDYMRLGEWK